MLTTRDLAIHPRDRVRVNGHPGELEVYVAPLYHRAVCVVIDGKQEWFSLSDITSHRRAEPIAWKAGDRFALRSGDGHIVRHGEILEWSEREQHWFLSVDPEPHPTGGYVMDGFKTWLPAADLVPMES